MEIIDILSYLGAMIIGFSLGLIGGGGSILTVPLLVYLVGIGPVLSTAYSLFVVGTAALIGAISNFKKGLVSVKTAVVFAIPSFISVYLTRRFLVPWIPEEIWKTTYFNLDKNMAIMIFFGLIMLAAAISMIRSKARPEGEVDKPQKFNYPLIIGDGLGVGLLTGIVGAGGGFLIIPALVLLAKLPMKLAVGTSLTIIAAKSLVGFVGDIQSGQIIDWPFLLTFTAFSVLGIILGGYASNHIEGKTLKKGFGWFVLVMSIFIISKELIR